MVVGGVGLLWVVEVGCGWLWLVMVGCGCLWMVVADFGWLWIVADGCGWLWLVAYFNITRYLIPSTKARKQTVDFLVYPEICVEFKPISTRGFK